MPEPSLLERLKQRKIIQWALAYAAGAFVVFQLLDALSEPLGLTTTIQRGILAVVVVGFFVTLVLAWYHGEKGQQRVSGSEFLMLGAVLVSAVALLWWVTARGPADLGSGQDFDSGPNSVAVLPCENVGGNEENAPLVDGLHISILNQLASVSGITSISRTSVLEYRGVVGNLRRIAEELGVGAVMECSVQREGARILVNSSLIDARTDRQLWGDTYDRTLEDAFAVQSDIARQVVRGVGARLTAAEATAMATAPTDDPEAYLLFMQGEKYRDQPPFDTLNLGIAQGFYERALELDPEFALAYASLAQVHGVLYWYGFDPFHQRREAQRSAAEAAIRLAPDLPRAHWALGWAYYHGERDYSRALEEFKVAAEGMPNSAEVWADVGYAHRRLGNWDEALEVYEKAIVLDPRDANIIYDLGGITSLSLHRYEEAAESFARSLELSPDFEEVELWKALTFLHWRGELDTLRSVLSQGPRNFGGEGSVDLWRARLAMWDQEPDTLLALLGDPETVIFESQWSYEPGFLYSAWAHEMHGDSEAAARAYVGALAQLDSALVDLPDDARLHASRGLALAGLGRRTEARAEAEWVRTWAQAPFDWSEVPYEAVAITYLRIGDREDALREIEELLRGPSMSSVHTIRLDPRFDPIRSDPRFIALMEELNLPIIECQ